MKGQYATGGGRPDYSVRRRRVSDDEWDELLAERRAPAAGRGTPMNILRRPVQLPPVINIQRGEEPEQ
jgi:hypothetical protein